MASVSALLPLAGQRVVVVNWRDLDHSLAGGSEIYAWELACGLRDGGAEVEFLTAREPGQEATTVRDGIVVRRRGNALSFYPHTALRLLARRRRVDAVIDPSCGLPSFAPLFVRRSTPVLLVMHHVHQEQFSTHFPRPVAALGKWLERVAMPAVYRRRPVVAVSESTVEEMRGQLGWTGPVGLLHNGADLPPLGAGNPLAKDPDRVAVLGRLVAHKRVDAVIRAIAVLCPTRPLLHLDVIGKGPERDDLERLAAELGIADRVTFHGFVDDPTKATLLARAAVHVCASDAEGWGQVVIEAAGHGVPTLARDVPGLRDSIQPQRTGWLVADDRDLDVVGGRLTATLAQALAEADDPAMRAQRFEACQRWAHHFDWEQMRREARDLVVHSLTTGAAPAVQLRSRKDRVAVMGGTSCVE
ncbi:glycosyltransferase family 4 protein [Nocardioides humilatus]|uniref:Glycosyltransferase family 4 protein n=1 Tax=Nocardioides humilatus TaxID=2607660 RepID=A0A5B1LE21_9ACTN|nr:glycosyltransferase family 4 protein [Nocardioides humilatus]KAA1417857.1 glycosyltransferase family 4 protein [Nocardioides humilatus]